MNVHLYDQKVIIIEVNIFGTFIFLNGIYKKKIWPWKTMLAVTKMQTILWICKSKNNNKKDPLEQFLFRDIVLK